MIRRVLQRLRRPRSQEKVKPNPPASLPPLAISPELPIPYSWVLTNRLAIGPMPASLAHWQQLEDAGLRSRFSCCYAEEERAVAVPDHWRSMRQPLPDHRRQERLDVARLAEVLERADRLLQEGSPLYLHCLAGIERSPLVAVGLTARARNLKLYDALDWVRRCHPAALPIFSHLELLEQILRRAPR